VGVLSRRQGTRHPRGAQQFHHPFPIDHEAGQQILDLDPPLAPIPAGPSPVGAYDSGQRAFDPGMLAPYRRIAVRRGAGRVVRGLLLILDDTAPLLLRESRQALGLQRTHRTMAPGKDKLPAAGVRVAGLRRRLLSARTRHNPVCRLEEKRSGPNTGVSTRGGGGT
jgi:hypothetical protein